MNIRDSDTPESLLAFSMKVTLVIIFMLMRMGISMYT